MMSTQATAAAAAATGRLPSTTAFLARPSIVLFGDSITEFGFGADATSYPGWISLLSSSYSRRADVFSRGYGGYNSHHAVDILPSVLRDTKRLYADGGNILFWTVFFGANDAVLPGWRQHIPLDEYGDNIRKIVKSIRKHSSEQSGEEPPIILISPPPINKDAWTKFCMETYGVKRSDRSNESSKTYGSKLKEIGNELGCPILDTYQLLDGDGESYPKYLLDGLHMNAEGNQLLYSGLMDLIQSKYPQFAPMTEGGGRYGSVGIPIEEKLWTEICWD